MTSSHSSSSAPMNVPPPTTAAGHLNNHAAIMINMGEYDAAVAMLIDAVRHYKNGSDLLSDAIQSPDGVVGRKRAERFLTAGYSYQPQHLKVMFAQRSQQASISISPEEALDRKDNFIYQTPILLDPSETNPLFARLSIVFNFAIAKHMRALQTGGNSSRREERLWSALKLYNWALAIERSMDELDSPLGALPCLGLINNCAQIHREMNNLDKANNMFHLLLNSLMLVKEREEEVTAQELDGFIHSISHLVLKQPAVAGAA